MSGGSWDPSRAGDDGDYRGIISWKLGGAEHLGDVRKLVPTVGLVRFQARGQVDPRVSPVPDETHMQSNVHYGRAACGAESSWRAYNVLGPADKGDGRAAALEVYDMLCEEEIVEHPSQTLRRDRLEEWLAPRLLVLEKP